MWQPARGGLTMNIWDNIIYGFKRGTSVNYHGILVNAGTQGYIYNNTVYGNHRGISSQQWGESGESVLLKNNLCNGNDVDYYAPYGSGAFDATSVANISQDTTSPNATLRSRTAAFVSTASGSEDFHLAASDTAARNQGVNLSADPYLAFPDDIDGQARPSSGAWDIGADTTILSGPLDHIIVTPTLATVAAGGVQQFTAQGYDAAGNLIPNLPFSWQVVNGGGTINAQGLFTAAIAGGLYVNTVQASSGGIITYASVEIVVPTVHHFTIAPIASPQYVGAPFSVSISARDASGVIVSAYTGTATLTDSTGTITPAVTGSFSNGLWTGSVAIGLAAQGITITALDGAATGTSNAIQTVNAYTVGGTLGGLASGATVAIQDNGTDTLVLSSNGVFTFVTPIPSGSTHSVTVQNNPTRQSCTVSNGSGTVSGSNITNVAISCSLLSDVNIYYSVGQNTSDHKTGSPTVTISGTTMTFSIAQTAPNMGVGDAVSYGSNVCYINGRSSSTVWSCIAARGGAPAPATNAAVNSIRHAYSSLNAALNGTAPGVADASHLNTTNLVTGDYNLFIPCYYDSGPDTTGNHITAFTTDATHGIKIYTPTLPSEVNQSQRHQGKWTTAAYRLETPVDSSLSAILTTTQNVWVEGLQIKVQDSQYQNMAGISFQQPAGLGQASKNIIWGSFSTSSNRNCGIYSTWNATSGARTIKIWDNIIYGFKQGTSVNYHGIFVTQGTQGHIYNNTVYGNYRGISSQQWGESGESVLLKNNLCNGNDVDYYAPYGSGAFDATSVANISQDTTSPNATLRSRTAAFASTISRSEDFHLAASDTAARNQGVNLSADPYLAFPDDIDGQARPSSGAWDIGADTTILSGPLDHIIVTPTLATVAAGGVQQFTAQGYDAAGNLIPNLPFSWQVVNGGGTISAQGLFTAGTAAGLYVNTVQASSGGIITYASVEIVVPTVHHFTIAPIASPQYVGAPFSVSISARDASGVIVSAYTGTATLTDSTGTITPSVTGSFSNGLWTGSVTIGQAAQGVTITALDGAATGTSNAIQTVNAYPVGGTLSGLASGATVAIQDNGTDTLVLSSNGTFTFATPIANGSTYSVTVLNNPTRQSCTVSNGSGTVSGSNITNVAVSCSLLSDVNIYYSVGQNTSDHKTGSPTVTISGTTMTFSIAQTAPNMGVGDAVSYGSNVCYINGRTSSTVWSCIAARGGAPAPATNAAVNSIRHAFSSLNAALNGTAPGVADASHLNTTNLVTGDYNLFIPCYYDSGPDTTGNHVTAFTTDATHGIKIYTPTLPSEVNQSQRHQGKWTTAAYRLEMPLDSSLSAIMTTAQNVWVEGLQIKVQDSQYQNMAGLSFQQPAGLGQASKNIIWGSFSTSSNRNCGIYSTWNATSGARTIKIWDNIIYGFKQGTSANFHGIFVTQGTQGYIYNNTVY